MSHVATFAVFIAYCVAGYVCLVAIIWAFEQLPPGAYIAIAIVGGGVIVWRLGPDHEDEMKLGDDGPFFDIFDTRGER